MREVRGEIVEACQLLFGESTPVSQAFIEYLRPSGLKLAFRALAMENHPDRATQLGICPRMLAERFQTIRSAYDLLMPIVSGARPLGFQPAGVQPPRPRSSPRARKGGKAAGGPQSNPRPQARPAARPDFTWPGAVPSRILRFGQYLYYHRQISWNTLIAALVWQRNLRPRLGELALERGWLRAAEMAEIRQGALIQEFWGESAVRLGYLSPEQLQALLGAQRLHNHPIGRYFTDHGHLSTDQLHPLLGQQAYHNFRIRSSAVRAG